jgi:hypothetical protein
MLIIAKNEKIEFQKREYLRKAEKYSNKRAIPH